MTKDNVENEPSPEELDSVTVKPWISKGGGMMVNAEALDIDDPDHVYNQILSQGKRPEDYGFKHPYAELYEDKSRGELINEIITLRKDLETMHRESAMW